MKIRAGYEISYDCPAPTPMIALLTVHPSRRSDLITQDTLRIDPAVPRTEYRDGFANICHVFRAPWGKVTLSTDFLINDTGEPAETAPFAEQHPLAHLPVETLV